MSKQINFSLFLMFYIELNVRFQKNERAITPKNAKDNMIYFIAPAIPIKTLVSPWLSSKC